MTFPLRSGTSSVVHVGFGGKLSLAIITTKSQNLSIAIYDSLAGMWKSGSGRFNQGDSYKTKNKFGRQIRVAAISFRNPADLNTTPEK